MKTFKLYEFEAMKTSTSLPKIELIKNAVLGLNGESGEIADLIKKHLYQGHDLHREKLIEELGDVLWYCALMSKALDISLSEVALKNIEKLRLRYGETFNAQRSVERKI